MILRRDLAVSLVLFALFAASGAAIAQEPAQSNEDRAGALYAQGRDAFMAGNAADAFLLLQASSALDPTPNTDLLLGHTLARLERVVDAILAYESAIERAKVEPRYSETAAEAVRRRAELAPRVGRIELLGPAGVKVSLTRPRMPPVEFDGPATVYSEIGLVTARWTAGNKPIQRSVTVESGSLVKLFIEEMPGSERIIDRTVSPWVPTSVVLASVGGVGLAVGVALGAVTQGLYDELEECTLEPCGDQSAAELRREGMDFQTATNVCLAGGSTFAVAGVVMLVVALVTEEDALPVKTTTRGLEISF